jgi:hypothetical protein
MDYFYSNKITKAEAAVTSRSKLNYIHINYRIIILQTEISGSCTLKGSVYDFFKVLPSAQTRVDRSTYLLLHASSEARYQVSNSDYQLPHVCRSVHVEELGSQRM